MAPSGDDGASATTDTCGSLVAVGDLRMFARFLATLMLALVAAFATIVAAPGQGATTTAALACRHAS
jgi:hypothetical protein